MASTRSATFSIRLKPETKKKLASWPRVWAQRQFPDLGRVESYVVDQERLRADIRSADRDVAGGHYVRDEDMKAWLLSWGTTESCRCRSALRKTSR